LSLIPRKAGLENRKQRRICATTREEMAGIKKNYVTNYTSYISQQILLEWSNQAV
jgi:hypothetical protein